jgi:hypothetical protein
MDRRLLSTATSILLILILAGILTNCASLTGSDDPRTVTIAVVEADPLTDG